MGLFLLVSCQVLADDLEESRNNYLQTYNNYYKIHQDYLITKKKYLTYKTLNSKNEALEKTKQLMIWRAKVLISYFEALNKRLEKTAGVAKSEVDLEKRLNEEIISYIKEEEGKVEGVAFLEDAIEKGNEFEVRKLEFEKRGKKTVSLILSAKATLLYKQLLDLEEKLNKKITKLKEEGKDVSLLERWMLEFKTKRENSQVKLEKAKELFSSLEEKKDEEELEEAFNKGQILLLESRQYVREAVVFGKELVREMNKGNYFD